MICCMTAKILPPPHSLAQHQMHTQSRFYRHLPGSKLLPELVTPQLKGHVLCLRTAVHRRCWRPPKGLGTNKTVEELNTKLTWCLTSAETIRLIRDGEKGEWGMEGGEEGEKLLYLSLHCHRQNDSCIKVSSDSREPFLMFQ